MKSYLALIGIDLKLAARLRVVIFFNYLFPFIFYFTFTKIYQAERSVGAVTQVLTMVIVLGLLGNGFFGAGIRAIQERELNILRRYKVTPISPVPLLVASMVSGWVIFMPFILAVMILSHLMYHMPWPPHTGALLFFISLGLVAFRAIGLVIASVANTMQEGQILVQILYFPMLFLSGATFPTSFFSHMLQTVSNFIPATYLVAGLQGIMLRGEGVFDERQAVGALVITAVVGMILSMKLFRWEKEEKIRASSKLWVAAVLLPFLALGTWQAHSGENAVKNSILARTMERDRSLLITDARLFVGDGKVIESGAVLVRNGKIAEVFESAPPNPKALQADVLEAAGKTVLPGLIDVHVHLGAPGGFDPAMQGGSSQGLPADAMPRELAAYLYSGVTAVKSAGDLLDPALQTRSLVNSGEKLGAELFICGPLFTAEGGHGTEYFQSLPPQLRSVLEAQFTRKPKTAQEAVQQVDELQARGVDGIKAILEGGAGAMRFNRLDPKILQAIAGEARAKNLPITAHTGDSHDVADALAAGVNGIEHGSARDLIAQESFTAMARQGVAYDPTLSVFEALHDLVEGKTGLLQRFLTQQVVPAELLQNTEKMMRSSETATLRQNLGRYPSDLETGKQNLQRAYQAGVMLVTGSDAGNLLVFHGPTVQRELELWVAAGIPPGVALQAATYNAARFLGAADHLGSIQEGRDADLVIVDGNPLQDISLTERISMVIFKGERLNRTELLNQIKGRPGTQ